MKMKTPLLGLLAVSFVGCGDREVGVRYRAERDLWTANRQYAQLAIRPQLVGDEQWRRLAESYEEIGEVRVPIDSVDNANRKARASRELRQIQARALVSAAQVHSIRRDSARVVQLFEQVVEEFGDVSQVVAEVGLAQGRLAEARRDAEAAATAYGLVLERVEPGPGEAGVAGAVMDLPLRIARLRALTAGDSTRVREPFYADAHSVYQGWIDSHPATLIELEARVRLADVAADVGDWDAALAILEALETDVVAEDPPPIDPARIRYGVAEVYRRTNDRSATVATLRSLVDDFPETAFAARALLVLASEAGTEESIVSLEEALAFLTRLRNDFPGAETILAQGQLMRGRLLEIYGRWGEAYDVYVALPVEYPLSEEALQSYLEIVNHQRRISDAEGLKAALARAEREYREFLSRYPGAPGTLSARIKLGEVLVQQARYDEAITHLVDIEDTMTGTQQGGYLLGEAARLAFTALGDSARALELLDRVAERYQDTRIGDSASNQAARLREARSK